MASLNKVQLIGNLGADAEFRLLPDSKPVARLRVATTDKWKDKITREARERTEWHAVVIYGALANIAADFAKKGGQVYIEGKLNTRKWADDKGVDRYSTEIIADVMKLLGPKRAGVPDDTTPPEEDDDIPF